MLSYLTGDVNVASAQPAVLSQGLGGGLRRVEVGLHDRIAACPYFTLFAWQDVRRVIQAIIGTGAGQAERETLSAIILETAPDAARPYLEELMTAIRSPFIESWKAVAREEARAEALAEGLAEGRAETKSLDILKVLNARGVALNGAELQRITTCTDLAQLDEWFDRALSATKATEVFRD
jgi:hypothetical protein